MSSHVMRRTYLHEMATKPHMRKHGPLEVHLLSGCAVTCQKHVEMERDATANMHPHPDRFY